MNDYEPLWNAFGLGQPAPVLGARLVSPSSDQDDSPNPKEVKALKPHEMRCIYYSELKKAYYVRVRYKGAIMQRAFFETAEDAMGIRDELEAKL